MTAAKNRSGIRKRGKSRFLLKLFLLAVFCGGVVFAVEAALAPSIQAQAVRFVENRVSQTLAQVIAEEVEADGAISDYQQLMELTRDDNGQVTMLSVNTRRLNAFTAGLLSALEATLAELGEQEIAIPLLSVTGSKWLAAKGPLLPVGVRGVAVPRIELTDSFSAAGINQTRHSIYLDVSVEVMVTVPFSADTCTVSVTVLLAEGIIVGTVPDTYVNIE